MLVSFCSSPYIPLGLRRLALQSILRGPCDRILLPQKLIFCFTRNSAALRDKISKVVTILAASWSCVGLLPEFVLSFFPWRTAIKHDINNTINDIFLSPWKGLPPEAMWRLGIGLSEPDKLTGSGTCKQPARYTKIFKVYFTWGSCPSDQGWLLKYTCQSRHLPTYL